MLPFHLKAVLRRALVVSLLSVRQFHAHYVHEADPQFLMPAKWSLISHVLWLVDLSSMLGLRPSTMCFSSLPRATMCSSSLKSARALPISYN